jgi:hypothetical protein
MLGWFRELKTKLKKVKHALKKQIALCWCLLINFESYVRKKKVCEINYKSQ